MTTFTLCDPLGPPGHWISVAASETPDGPHTMLIGRILRVSPHELLVRVGGRALAFQQHDGEGNGWTWRE